MRLAVAAARAKLLVLQLEERDQHQQLGGAEGGGAEGSGVCAELSGILSEVRSVVPGTVTRRNSISALFGDPSEKCTAVAEQRISGVIQEGTAMMQEAQQEIVDAFRDAMVKEGGAAGV